MTETIVRTAKKTMSPNNFDIAAYTRKIREANELKVVTFLQSIPNTTFSLEEISRNVTLDVTTVGKILTRLTAPNVSSFLNRGKRRAVFVNDNANTTPTVHAAFTINGDTVSVNVPVRQFKDLFMSAGA
ncbi:hypothetical protein UFOVP75_151 [uncultured Caudovirales phage]|uniref:Uncharacterized protein n=1 Tax=uncultured Caudovirales phage TaxID=2100421 RepID=A0A6J5L2A1_9CAUD|nr:hypothetical protein UFOVP75_151 [uncultured Caudovirales phage]